MLTAQEAKDKCLQVWRYIEKHITDDDWRTKVMDRYANVWGTLDDHMKRYAFLQLFPDDSPNSDCYLCEFHRILSREGWRGCRGCALGQGEEGDYNYGPCMESRRPYASFILNVRQHRWTRAAAAAHRLVTTVERWDI